MEEGRSEDDKVPTIVCTKQRKEEREAVDKSSRKNSRGTSPRKVLEVEEYKVNLVPGPE